MHSLSRGSAARTVSLLSVMFSYAVKRKLRPDNPCKGLEMPAEVKRNRRLSDAEYAQLGMALKGGMTSDIFLLLAVTGFRSSEAEKLSWSECDFESVNIVTLGDSKTGPLASPTQRCRHRDHQDAKRRTSAHTCLITDHGKPIANLRSHWLRLKMLRDITPHVLRHSFATLSPH